LRVTNQVIKISSSTTLERERAMGNSKNRVPNKNANQMSLDSGIGFI